jgi:hypothetical protein
MSSTLVEENSSGRVERTLERFCASSVHKCLAGGACQADRSINTLKTAGVWHYRVGSNRETGS